MIELRSPRTERFADVAEWRISWQMRNKQPLIWDFSAGTEGFEIAPMAIETHWNRMNPRVLTWRMLD